MSGHAYRAPHACKRPNIANLDHRLGHTHATERPIVNRVCLTCLTHWYGDAEAAVFEIPGRIWDRWMESALPTGAAA